MFKIAVLLSGRGSNFISIHKNIVSGYIPNATINCVISNYEKCGGIEYAKNNGINTFYLDNSCYSSREQYDESILEILQNNEIDLVCLAGYMRIVSKVLVEPYHGRIMNIHPSLLPSFPGLRAQKQALDYGVKVSGCTVHFVDTGIDTGPIILQKCVEVMPNDSEDDLSKRILEEEHKLYPEAIRFFVMNKLKLTKTKVTISN